MQQLKWRYHQAGHLKATQLQRFLWPLFLLKAFLSFWDREVHRTVLAPKSGAKWSWVPALHKRLRVYNFQHLRPLEVAVTKGLHGLGKCAAQSFTRLHSHVSWPLPQGFSAHHFAGLKKRCAIRRPRKPKCSDLFTNTGGHFNQQSIGNQTRPRLCFQQWNGHIKEFLCSSRSPLIGNSSLLLSPFPWLSVTCLRLFIATTPRLQLSRCLLPNAMTHWNTIPSLVATPAL